MKVFLQFILLDIIHATTVNSIEQRANANDACPDDWLFNPTNRRCYFISNQLAKFDVASKKCESMSSHLASILSLDEQTFLLRSLDNDWSNNSSYWFGLRSNGSNHSSWKWIDGSLFSNRMTFWGKTFPTGKFNCVSFSATVNEVLVDGHWEDENCDRPLRYICKNVALSNTLAKQFASTFSLMKEMYLKASGYSTTTVIDCPKGWFTVPPFTACFYLGKDDVKYSTAEESCKSRSSSLTKLYSVEEIKSLAQWIAMERNTCLYYEVCSKFWIGLRFSNVPSKEFSGWIWSDGSLVSTDSILTMSSFGVESPSDKSHQCATLHIDDFNQPTYAMVSNCGKPFRYICRKDVLCPEGFAPDPKVNSCYKLIKDVMNWTDASAKCHSISPDVHLASMLSDADKDSIIAFFESEIRSDPYACKSSHTGYSPNAWIGARRIKENCTEPFAWMLSDSIQIPIEYKYWIYNQPTCGNGVEHCLHITQIWAYRWNDHVCSDMKCAICQRRYRPQM